MGEWRPTVAGDGSEHTRPTRCRGRHPDQQQCIRMHFGVPTHIVFFTHFSITDQHPSTLITQNKHGHRRLFLLLGWEISADKMRIYQIISLGGLGLLASSSAFMVPAHRVRQHAAKTSFRTQVQKSDRLRWLRGWRACSDVFLWPFWDALFERS